jgi:hypothetical protein
MDVEFWVKTDTSGSPKNMFEKNKSLGSNIVKYNILFLSVSVRCRRHTTKSIFLLGFGQVFKSDGGPFRKQNKVCFCMTTGKTNDCQNCPNSATPRPNT